MATVDVAGTQVNDESSNYNDVEHNHEVTVDVAGAYEVTSTLVLLQPFNAD